MCYVHNQWYDISCAILYFHGKHIDLKTAHFTMKQSALHPTPKPTSCTQLLTHSHSTYFEAISHIHNLNMCQATVTHNALHSVS